MASGTTVRLPDSLKSEATAYAESAGVSLNGLIGIALRYYLDQVKPTSPEADPKPQTEENPPGVEPTAEPERLQEAVTRPEPESFPDCPTPPHYQDQVKPTSPEAEPKPQTKQNLWGVEPTVEPERRQEAVMRPEPESFLDCPMPPQRSQKVGRNQPCPCGSGKKYKVCCGP